MSNSKLYLFDAMALIYRAYFAFQRNPRITSTGINTSAAFGFTTYLYEIIKKEKPTHLAVCFDSQKPTFRHEQYEQYKANRSAMPEDIASNIPYIKEILAALNVPMVICQGFEADDIIGTIATKACKEGYEVFMVTPDKDFGQIVNDCIKMYKPAYGNNPAEILDEQKVCEKFGLKNTRQMIDYLGLVGDSSDNIPGVPGVGPVGAKKLLDEFDNIENIIANADQIKNQSLRQKIIDNKELAIQSKQLATIITDAPCDNDIDSFKLSTPNVEELKAIFETLEFRTLGNRIFTELSLGGIMDKADKADKIDKADKADKVDKMDKVDKGDSALGGLFANENELGLFTDIYDNINTVKHEYILLKDEKEIDDFVEKLKNIKAFAFDVETTGLDPNNCELVGFSISFEKHKAYYISCPDNFDETHKIVSKFKMFFENPDILIIGQNLKFDFLVLKWYDITVKSKIFDTMIAHYLINQDAKHNMDYLAQVYLNYNPVPIEDLIGKRNANQSNMRNVEIETLKEYAAEDADVTYQLYLIFKEELKKTNNVKIFEDIEMPLVKVLTDMEFEGVRIDTDALKSFSEQLETQIHKLVEEIYDYAGEIFNINSPKQLGEILFDKLQIAQKPKKTKTGQYSTGEDILSKLRFIHPIVDDILNYRSLTKLKSTYVEPLPLLINPRTGRVHTTYNQAVVATGRLSSNNPNLQNIPIRSENGKEIRKAFVPRNNNYVLLSADYSQIELRVIAHISGDQNMIEAFKEGKDIHAATAAKVFAVPENEVTSDMRRIAKVVNFGIIYGMSPFGLSEELNIPRKKAAEIIEQYFINFPGIKQYMENSVAFAREHGYIETILGRRRLVKDINSRNNVTRNYAERFAINAPIQGSSADMIKIAMISIEEEIVRRELKSRMILQVHDELVFDTHESEIEQLSKLVEEKMRTAIELQVPIEVSIGIGKNWLEAH
ncbi:DNA polymerase I [Odoribacter sp. OttesenSCG-928-L07]|nr:DNA polymerase I [Odoribacter sp. OttesenSCG-928-L07]MDL2239863.1 DNA polymerase I [Bacteroidales bacterium OttesenSCG-928-L14]MDL2241199.1 DNA polymerase I [Bacteroidales bacterium OttesenSCG-928-K22]